MVKQYKKLIRIEEVPHPTKVGVYLIFLFFSNGVNVTAINKSKSSEVEDLENTLKGDSTDLPYYDWKGNLVFDFDNFGFFQIDFVNLKSVDIQDLRGFVDSYILDSNYKVSTLHNRW